MYHGQRTLINYLFTEGSRSSQIFVYIGFQSELVLQ